MIGETELAQIDEMLLLAGHKLGHGFIFKLNNIRGTLTGLNGVLEFGVFTAALAAVIPANLKIIVGFVEIIHHLFDSWIPSPNGNLLHTLFLNGIGAGCTVISGLIAVDLGTIRVGASATSAYGQCHSASRNGCHDPGYFLHELLLWILICSFLIVL